GQRVRVDVTGGPADAGRQRQLVLRAAVLGPGHIGLDRVADDPLRDRERRGREQCDSGEGQGKDDNRPVSTPPPYRSFGAQPGDPREQGGVVGAIVCKRIRCAEAQKGGIVLHVLSTSSWGTATGAQSSASSSSLVRRRPRARRSRTRNAAALIPSALAAWAGVKSSQATRKRASRPSGDNERNAVRSCGSSSSSSGAGQSGSLSRIDPAARAHRRASSYNRLRAVA